MVSSFNHEHEPEIVREAEHFLKKHAEILPKLDEDGVEIVSLPSMALKYLGKWLKLKDRTQPSLFVIRK